MCVYVCGESIQGLLSWQISGVNTVILTEMTMPYIVSPEHFRLETENLYPLTNGSPLPPPSSLEAIVLLSSSMV